MAIEIENIDSNLSKAMDQEEARVEQLLSEKLMEGYVLLEKSCPVCSTPLVKNHDDEDDEEESIQKDMKPVMIPNGSFTQPFRPVNGVPLCVSCYSHVITQECEISILENCGSLKVKGGIIVALSGSAGVSAESDDDRNEEEEVHEIIDVTKIEIKDTDSGYADEKKEEDLVEETLTEYSVRREIATKVLGAKMLQGYALMEKQCDKCGMPTMEYQGLVECVVCPALIKKARKQLKAQKKLEKETLRLQREINNAKMQKIKEDKKAIEAAALEDQRRYEETVKVQKERIERETKEREQKLLREKEADQARRLEIIQNEKNRVAALEAEQARLVIDAKSHAVLEAQETAKHEQAKALKAKENEAKFEEIRQAKAKTIEMEHAAAAQKRKELEAKIAEESKRLEALEQRRRMGLATAFESMNRDVLVAEHRKRLETKAKLDLTIARLELDIANEEQETKTITDDKRAEVEARMIALLEEEAEAKAKAAEEAIRKAKAALEHVHSARREVIAQTIALAEQEAIAEAEDCIKKEREDYKAPVLLPSASEIKRENWETLRTEGRSVMTRRVMAGWVLLADFCQGVECHSTPLITKDGKRECVVCGGCGDGSDGAYIDIEDYDVVPTDDELRAMRENGVMPDEDDFTGYEITPSGPRPISPTAGHTFEEIQQDFDTKRNMVSKEIGRRMIEGWTLLDSSCPHCVMPLMMDTCGNTDICVLCGLVDTIQNNDGSTIKNEEVPEKSVEVPEKSTPVTPTIIEEKAPTTSSDSVESNTSEPETKAYTDDAETMYTTIPTLQEQVSVSVGESVEDVMEKSVEETVEELVEDMIDESIEKTLSATEDLPSAPTFDKTATTYSSNEEPRDDLAESIRAYSQRNHPALYPARSDPPASLKPPVVKLSIDPAPIDEVMSSKSTDTEKLKRASSTVEEELATNVDKPDKDVQVVDDEASFVAHKPCNDPEEQDEHLEVVYDVEASSVVQEPSKELQEQDENLEIEYDVEASSVVQEPSKDLQEQDEDLEVVYDKASSIVQEPSMDLEEVEDLGVVYEEETLAAPSSAFSAKITGTATGHEATLQECLTREEVEDLVDAYVATSLDPSVSKEEKWELSNELKRKMSEEQNTPHDTDSDGVIHLEDFPSPQNFKFDMVASDEPNSQTANTKKKRPTPETMIRPRGTSKTPASRGMPPRPESTTSARGSSTKRGSPRRIPRSTTSSRSPRTGGFVVTAGQSDVTSLGEMSRAESVATDALDSILDRIDVAKAILLRDDVTIKEQLEAANLIERLAQAAVAVKALERFDH